MSEYAYADLFVSLLDAQNSVAANFMTIVSAMLVASWFLAAKFNRVTAAVSLIIYSLWTLNLVFSVYAVFGDFASLGVHLNALYGGKPSSLEWLGPVKSGAQAMSVMRVFVALGAFLTYAASIVFFFMVRRRRIDAAVVPGTDV